MNLQICLAIILCTANASAQIPTPIAELYGSAISKARLPKQKTELAWKMLHDAAEMGNSPADNTARRALFVAAKKLAMDARDGQLAVGITLATIQRFQATAISPTAELSRADGYVESAKKLPSRKRFDLHVAAAVSYLLAGEYGEGFDRQRASLALQKIADTLPPATTEPSVSVISAVWGHKNSQVDVTKVLGHALATKRFISVGTNLAGDPAFGKLKTLHVIYLAKNGMAKSAMFQDGQVVILP